MNINLKIFLFAIIQFVLCGNYVYAQAGAATCATATSLTVNGTCGSGATSGTVVSAGSNPTVCGGTVRTDRWYKFTTLNTTGTTTIVATSVNPSSGNRNIALELLSACSSASITCANAAGVPATETMTANLTPLTTYYLRIANVATSVTPVSMNYNTVCIKQPPEFDEPLGATTLTLGNSVCNYLTCDASSATSSNCVPLPACGDYTPTTSGGTSKDVWFKLVVPASGNFFLQTLAGSMYNAGMAVYSSSICGSASILGCSDGNPNGVGTYTDAPMSMPSLNITGASAGTTVYIRVWNKTGYPIGTFNICANDMTPCGNLPTNDFCSNAAAILTSGATMGSIATNTTTGIVYTQDNPGDIDVTANANGCIYPALNSWYSFIATNTDEISGLTIPFTLNTTSCTGLEAVIYNVTKTSNGCCKNLTQLSDCNGFNYDPIANNTFTVTVPPGSLVAGNTYYLMINNFEVVPSACSFSITGWAVSGVLPVEFVSFKGNNEGKYNVLEWVTSFEQNISSYELESSNDAVHFRLLESVKAKGSMSSNSLYKVLDNNPFPELTYYRVKQIETNGSIKYSNVISVSLKNFYDNIFNVQPNPTSDFFSFDYYSKGNSNISLELIGYAGNTVFRQTKQLDEGKNNITLPMNELDNGVYILKVVSEKSGKTTHHKIIKN